VKYLENVHTGNIFNAEEKFATSKHHVNYQKRCSACQPWERM